MVDKLLAGLVHVLYSLENEENFLQRTPTPPPPPPPATSGSVSFLRFAI